MSDRVAAILGIFLCACASGSLAAPDANATAPASSGPSHPHRPRVERIRAVLGNALDDVGCTDADTPWDVAHYLLAAGRDAAVASAEASGPPVSAAAYLCTRARGADGSVLFARAADGTVRPATQNPPSRRFQDHHNQFLADIAVVYVDDPRRPRRPPDIPEDLWRTLLAGAWSDYRLDEECSWTLICYVKLLPDLPAQRSAVLRRIDEMVRALGGGAYRTRAACGGAHVLHALAIYARSPWAELMPADLNHSVRGRLEAGLVEARRWARLFPGPARPAAPTPGTQPRLADVEARVSMLGHTLEWVVEFQSPAQLREPDAVGLAERLCDMVDVLSEFRVGDRGGYFHALHALRTYADKTGAAE